MQSHLSKNLEARNSNYTSFVMPRKVPMELASMPGNIRAIPMPDNNDTDNNHHWIRIERFGTLRKLLRKASLVMRLIAIIRKRHLTSSKARFKGLQAVDFSSPG